MASSIAATDAEFVFVEPVPARRVAELIARLGEIGEFETWGYNQTTFAQDGRIEVMRTYPDRGHGSFGLYGVPPGTRLIKFPMIEGRWLEEGDIDAVVLTATILRRLPAAKIGDRIILAVNGKPIAWRLVGVVGEVGGANAYVSDVGYARASGSIDTAGALRITASIPSAENRERIIRAVERALDDVSIAVERSVPLTRIYDAMV
jgi:putative ABC transport system permease protein